MTNLLNATPAEFCASTKACPEGRRFALGYSTMAEVWDACPRADWLLWIVRKVDRVPDDRTLRLFAIWCARHTPLGDGRVTGDLFTDSRSVVALEVAERYANGMVTQDEMAAACGAACGACGVRGAEAAAGAAAGAAAWGAAWGAASAAAGAAAWVSAEAARKAQADQLRRVVANPFRKEASHERHTENR